MANKIALPNVNTPYVGEDGRPTPAMIYWMQQVQRAVVQPGMMVLQVAGSAVPDGWTVVDTVTIGVDNYDLLSLQ